ncbi:MAG: rod shape-determining protein RodA, partial [Cryomorphaceae bacterium]|nr:rod shape-determining protein RodA [Cryomorphaceae bacterium]
MIKIKNPSLFLFSLLILLFTYNLTFAAGSIPRSLSNSDAGVFIISPLDNAVVSSPIEVVFGVKNMTISPAGIKKDLSGH